jgi:hypothetical protein
MFVLLWIIGEFTGAIAGAVIFKVERLQVYLFALLGAGLGTLLTFLIVTGLSNKNISKTPEYD